MALPAHMYHDPARQALDKEAATCKGCRWRYRDDDIDAYRCTNARRPTVLADKRCMEYEEPNR